MLGEEQFDCGAACGVDFGGLALNLHAFCYHGGARGHEALALVDFHEADLTGVQRATLFHVAKRRDVESRLPRRGEDAFTG